MVSPCAPPRTLTKAPALTFILNTKGIVRATRNWVAFNSHINGSRDLLFITPLVTHGCPETDKEDAVLGGLAKNRKEQFFSAVCSESAEIFLS